MVARMFGNPTNATPNLPDAPPSAGGNRRRRHSLGGGGGQEQPLPPPSLHSRSTSSGGKKAMRRSGSLDATLTMNILQDEDRARSGGSNHSYGRRSASPKTLPAAPVPQERRRSSSSKKKPGRSRSFDTPDGSQSTTVRSSKRESMRRRDSGDSRGSDRSSNTAPFQSVPQSPRETMRAKREQMRRKSMGSCPTPQELPPQPPAAMVNLLDIGSDDESVESLLPWEY